MDPDLTSALAGWADGKSLGVGLAAINALRSANEVRQFLEWRRTLTGLFCEEPEVDERQWRRFYNSPKSLERQLTADLAGDKADTAMALMQALRTPKKADKETKLLAVGLIIGFLTPGSASEWEKVLPLLFPDEDDAEFVPSADGADSIAFTFYLWVHLPCWFVYGVPTTKLLRTVSGGGDEAETAVTQLVRLDHRVIGHATIQRWIHADQKLAPFRLAKIHKWRKRAPFDKEKSASLSLRMLAGFASRTSELADDRLEAREIRNLVEALGDIVPADLQSYLVELTPDDWSRVMRRQHEHLVKGVKPDKSTFESVRRLRELLG